MSDNIPFDIQNEIIKKLPIKSLIQFRSVSKTWMSVIDSPQFIAGYQQQTHLQQHLLVGNAYGDNYVSFVDNDTFPHQKVSLTLPDSALNLNKPLLVGSSQGLICFYNYFQVAVIWNPTIRKSVDVVVPLPKGLDVRFSTTVVGFGVCPRTLDPMLVRISTEYNSLIKYLKNTVVEVFRLSSGVWKSFCVDLPWYIAMKWNQVVIDKFIYWLAIDQMTTSHLIMSFDMTSEEFTEIRLPDSIVGVNVGTGIELFICNLKESLVVLQCDCEYDFSWDLGVWMMDNGDPKSFKSIYTIKRNIPDTLITSVLAFNRNGDAIVEMIKELNDEEEEYELFVYELNSHDVNVGISAERSSFFVSSYTGTLLLLDH